MTVRISEPNLWNTEALLAQVLVPLVKDEDRVLFLCDPSTGKDVVQRLRVMISRKRDRLERRGKKARKFRLHSTIHQETHSGKRFDAVVLWKTVSEQNLMSQELEDLLVIPAKQVANG